MTIRDPIRVACEHEAAHAVSAWALGVHVAHIVVNANGAARSLGCAPPRPQTR